MKSKHLIADIAAKARALKNRAGEVLREPSVPSTRKRKATAPGERKAAAKKTQR